VDHVAAQKGIARVEAQAAGSGLGGSLRHTGRERGSGRCSPEAMYGGGSTDFSKQQGPTQGGGMSFVETASRERRERFGEQNGVSRKL
jgi:hypothetical protein